MESGWALKSKQKYGKRGSGKRISKRVWEILEGYFLEGDVDKSKRYTATTMLENLKKKLKEENWMKMRFQNYKPFKVGSLVIQHNIVKNGRKVI